MATPSGGALSLSQETTWPEYHWWQQALSQALVPVRNQTRAYRESTVMDNRDAPHKCIHLYSPSAMPRHVHQLEAVCRRNICTNQRAVGSLVTRLAVWTIANMTHAASNIPSIHTQHGWLSGQQCGDGR